MCPGREGLSPPSPGQVCLKSCSFLPRDYAQEALLKVGLLSAQERHGSHLTLSPNSFTASPPPTDLYSWVRMA